MESSTSTLRRPRVRPVSVPIAESLAGRVVCGRYVIGGLLGGGGVGTVFAATDRMTGEAVAIKTLKPGAITSANLRRLRREAEVTARLHHPHIGRVHHLGVHAGVPFLVMERLYGETLAQRIQRLGSVPPADVIGIAIQILDALSTAHAAGILHRDVKPSNIFVTTPPGVAPQVKLIDFGMARPLNDEDETAITRNNLVPGTPQYLTPEQVRGARDLDERVDVWAVGLVCIEMLIGCRVFPSTDGTEVLLTNILNKPVPAVANMRGDVPPELDAVLSRAVAKKRHERFATAKELRDALIVVWARFRAEGIARGMVMRSGTARR